MKRLIAFAALCCAAPALAQSAQDLVDESNGYEADADEALEQGDAYADSWRDRACTEYRDAGNYYIKAAELMLDAGNQDPSIKNWALGRVQEIQENAELAVAGVESQCGEYDGGDDYDSDYDDYDDDY